LLISSPFPTEKLGVSYYYCEGGAQFVPGIGYEAAKFLSDFDVTLAAQFQGPQHSVE
jgi:hypothetical protein